MKTDKAMKISDIKKQFEIRMEKARREYDIAVEEKNKIEKEYHQKQDDFEKEYQQIWKIVSAKYNVKNAELDRLGKILANINKLEEVQKGEL